MFFIFLVSFSQIDVTATVPLRMGETLASARGPTCGRAHAGPQHWLANAAPKR
jgi:hypothetical protein